MSTYNVTMPIAVKKDADWNRSKRWWGKVKRGTPAVRDFNLLTIKALYVVGVILNNCRSVSILMARPHLPEVTFFAAYGAAAAAIELLGRCLRGNMTDKQTGDDLLSGVFWLARPGDVAPQKEKRALILIETPIAKYSIADLVDLRHFSAHGQGVNQSEIKRFDYGVLDGLPVLLSKGLGEWLTRLQSDSRLAYKLAKANVTPFRSRPVFDALRGMQGGNDYPKSAANHIKGMDWSAKWPDLAIHDV